MKKRNRAVYFFQETAIVVIGVLIAVSIGNYKEKLNNQKYLEKTLLAIEKEIEMSQPEVDTVLTRHIMLLERLESEIGGNEQTLGAFIASSGGFQIASVKNVSLRFFVSNKAELLEFGLISQLLEIELKTNLLSDKCNRLADFAYEYLNDSSDEAKIKFAYFLADVIDGEQSLLESYTDFLDRNKNDLKEGEK